MAGDGLALAIPSGLALLRVVRVKTGRLGETPILELLQFEGFELPSQEELEKLKPRVKHTIALGGEPRFSAFIAHDKIAWEQAGFRKVASFAHRLRDEEAYATSGISWAGIAGLLLAPTALVNK